MSSATTAEAWKRAQAIAQTTVQKEEEKKKQFWTLIAVAGGVGLLVYMIMKK